MKYFLVKKNKFIEANQWNMVELWVNCHQFSVDVKEMQRSTSNNTTY